MSTALIVIDVQESFRQQPAWADISDPHIAERVAALVDHARGRGDEVVWILHAEPGSGGPFDPDKELVTLQPGLEPREGEPILLKTSHNAFTTTNLQQLLVRRGVTSVRLAGIRTEQCVETTARLASDLGYDVELVIDATATHPLALHDGTGVLAAQDVIARTAAALSGRFARIVRAADVMAS